MIERLYMVQSLAGVGFQMSKCDFCINFEVIEPNDLLIIEIIQRLLHRYTQYIYIPYLAI